MSSEEETPLPSWLGHALTALAALSLVVATVHAVLVFRATMPANGDAEAAYLVIPHFERGGPFNTVRMVDTSDIGRQDDYFLTWWTPGQWVIPWLFSQLPGLNLWQAGWVVTLLAITAGIGGFVMLCREFRFRDEVTLLSVVIIATQMPFYTFFRSYTGGQVLEFAIAPWLLWAAARLAEPNALRFVLVLALAAVAFFFKSSTLLCFVAVAVFLAVVRVREAEGGYLPGRRFLSDRRAIGFLFLVAFAWGAFLLLAKVTFLDHGETPSSITRATHNTYPDNPSTAGRYLFATVAPALDTLWIPRLFLERAGRGNAVLAAAGYAVALLLMVAVLAAIGRADFIDRRYRELLIILWLVYTLILGASFVRGTPISLETRHFRPVALLLVPGVVALLLHWRGWVAAVTLAAVVFLNMAATNYLAVPHLLRALERRFEWRGYSYTEDVREDLETLRTLDELHPPGTALFYIMPWNRGLEFSLRHNPVYPLGLAGTGIPALRDTPYFGGRESHPGIVPHLIVVTDHKAEEAGLRSMFSDYGAFEVIAETDRSRYWQGVAGEADRDGGAAR